MFEPEEGIDINKPKLQGLQELFTDFDSWTIKFKNIIESSSESAKTRRITTEGCVTLQKHRQNNSSNVKTVSLIPFDQLYIHGLIDFLKRPTYTEKYQRLFRKMDTADDFLIDYVIFRLTNGNKYFQVIRCKL